mmetsp:Transcript_20331/g.37005  ORF Transcript_20331/g.37005 Transcript_20331/m.37005 type:complete len:353 (-) Transcript_20331:60-1118(-)
MKAIFLLTAQCCLCVSDSRSVCAAPLYEYNQEGSLSLVQKRATNSIAGEQPNAAQFSSASVSAAFTDSVLSMENANAVTRNAATRINDRFLNGQPSNDISNVGVFVRSFDHEESVQEHPPWGDERDPFVSASIINSMMPYTFQGGRYAAAGLVLSPAAATASMLCSFHRDGATGGLHICENGRNGNGAECVTGCFGETKRHGYSEWCSLNKSINEAIEETWPLCAYPPNALELMMLHHKSRVEQFLDSCRPNCKCHKNGCCADKHCPLYNEVVLDTDSLMKSLPFSLEAIYFLAGYAARSPYHAKEAEIAAKTAQQLIYATFRKYVPLVIVSNFSSEAPFEPYYYLPGSHDA